MNRRSLVLSASALGAAAFAGGSWLVRDRQAREAAAEADARTAAIPDPVSYTHLTLPTILRV